MLIKSLEETSWVWSISGNINIKGLATFWEYMFYRQKKVSNYELLKKNHFHTNFFTRSNLGLLALIIITTYSYKNV